MAIQVLKPKFHIEECLNSIKECLEKGWTGMGFKTVEFEEAWKRYTGHKYAYFLNSNTAGLHLAVKILKMRNGWSSEDEIISTPITFVSTNHAVLYENGFLCSTASEWEEAITMLLTNVESQQRIVDNAQRLLRTKFSVQAIEEKIIKQFPEILNYYSNREEDVNLVFVKQRYKIFCVAEKVFAIGREFRKGGAIKAFKRVRLYFNTKRQAHQDELRVDRGR